MSNVHHHKHMRKRLYALKQPFPNKNARIRFLDRLATWLGLGTSIVTFHQVYLIFSNQDAGSVSTFAWIYFTVFAVTFLIYGVIHKEKPIIITYSLMAISNALVVVGSLIY